MKRNITWNAASQGWPMLVFWYRRTLPGCICKCDRVTMGSWHVHGEQKLPRIPTTGSPASRTHQTGALLATIRPLPTLMMEGKQEGALKPSGELPQNLVGSPGVQGGGQHQVCAWETKEQELWWELPLQESGERERVVEGTQPSTDAGGQPGGDIGMGSPRGLGGPERHEDLPQGSSG